MKALTLIFIVALSGCTSITKKPPQSELQAATDACFSGAVAAYHRAATRERVSVVCK